MLENSQLEVNSPCIGVCAIDESNGLCHGCYRSIGEIKAWWHMSQGEQKDLRAVLEKRQAQVENF